MGDLARSVVPDASWGTVANYALPATLERITGFLTHQSNPTPRLGPYMLSRRGASTKMPDGGKPGFSQLMALPVGRTNKIKSLFTLDLSLSSPFHHQRVYMPTLKVIGLEKPVAIESIVWIQGDGNYARLYFANNQFYLATQTLNWFTQQLPMFIRLHKSALANPGHMLRFTQLQAKEAQVLVRTGQVLEIARRRIRKVRQQLGMAPYTANSFQVQLYDNQKPV